MLAGPGLEIRVAQTFEKSAPAIVAISILLTIVTGLALSPMPEFQTDLAEAEGLVNVMLATLTDNAALSNGRTPEEHA